MPLAQETTIGVAALLSTIIACRIAIVPKTPTAGGDDLVMPTDADPYRDSAWLSPQAPREGLGHYAEVVREHLVLIIACTIVAAGVAAAYSKLASPTWKATSNLLVTPVGSEPSLAGLGLITNSGSPASDTSTASSIVTTPEVASSVASKLGKATSSEVLREVAAVPVAESSIVAITATSSSAARAQEVANAFATETVEYETTQLHNRLDKIIPALERAAESAPVSQRSGQGSLGERIASLQAMRAAPDPNFSVASLAARPTSQSWPRTKLSVVVGAFVGLLLGAAIVFIRDGLDPKIRREDDLRAIFRLPILARIPRERRGAKSHSPLRPDQISTVAVESYRMLFAALQGRNAVEAPGDHTTSRSLMVTGSTSAEGKSTVALNLAWTLALAGRDVVLIEADVRRPSLRGALRVEGAHGIADVLINDVQFEDALTTVPGTNGRLRAMLADKSGEYLADDLLTAGVDMVAEASRHADYVIVDAPPVTAVSDAVPLSRRVDDVIVVVRLGHSRTDNLVKLGEIFTRQAVRPVGIVTVGDHVGASMYYAESKRRPRFRGRRGREQQPPALTRG